MDDRHQVEIQKCAKEGGQTELCHGSFPLHLCAIEEFFLPGSENNALLHSSAGAGSFHIDIVGGLCGVHANITVGVQSLCCVHLHIAIIGRG